MVSAGGFVLRAVIPESPHLEREQGQRTANRGSKVAVHVMCRIAAAGGGATAGLNCFSHSLLQPVPATAPSPLFRL